MTGERPLVLAVDTAAGLSLGLTRGSTVLARHGSGTPQAVDVALLPTVAAWVDTYGVPDRVVVGTGPGSFTGTRVGVVAAKTLAWAWSVPLVGVSSLAADAAAAGWPGAVVVATTELLRDELYVGVYRCRDDGVDPLVADQAWRLGDVPRGWEGAGPVLVTGPLADQAALMAQLGAAPVPAAAVFRAGGLAQLGRTAPPVDPLGLEPQYLRPATRAAERSVGHGRL